MEAAGYVLAGGRSSRMGRDKALLELGGETLVERAVRSLGEVCGAVTIVGGLLELERYGLVIGDAVPGCGPLGGVVAALETTACEWNLILAVDAPFVPASAWRQMMGWAEGSDAVAVLPLVAGREQPLCGLYSRRAAAGLRRELEGGNLKIMRALAAVGRVHLMRFEETHWFRNLNTPEEFAEAEAGHIR